MSDLQDGPDHAGNGTNRDTGNRTSVSNEALSPTASRKGSQASPADQPKKKRKVNHGSMCLLSSLVRVGYTAYDLRFGTTPLLA
ncbi:hypothetical protein KCU88_g291, partial [Aureobasidium melanogenum]